MTNVLARKGSIHLVKYEGGLYSVEKITKSIGMGLATGYDKEAIVQAFNEHAKKARRSKHDFNLDLYGMDAI